MLKIPYVKYYLITGKHQLGFYFIEKRVTDILEMHKTCFEFEEMGLTVTHQVELNGN